jgi:acetyl esterase/lipase
MDQQFAEITPALCVDGVQNHDEVNSPESKFLGGPVQERLELSKAANPVHYAEIATDVPPFFFAVGDSDCLVPHQQTLILHEAVSKRGAQTQLHVLKDVGHAGPIFEELMTPKVLEWLESIIHSGGKRGI